MNLYLSEYISIVGTDITTLIKEKVFDHLQKWFLHISEKVDKLTKNLDFVKAFKKIDEQKEIFKIINQEIGLEIKELTQFSDLQNLSRAIQEKNDVVK